MASNKTQLNTCVPDDLAVRVKVEAVKQNVDLGAISTEAYTRFLSLPISQRREIFKKYRKTAGRKIAATSQKNFADGNRVLNPKPENG